MSIFNSKNTPQSEYNPNSLNIINAGTEVRGDILSNGDVRIDGILRGTITTKAKVVIGTTGSVEGDIKAQNSDVSGTVKGNIAVDELLSLKATAKIQGDILTKKLIVETGGEFNGKCPIRSTGDSSKNARPEQSQAKPVNA